MFKILANKYLWLLILLLVVLRIPTFNRPISKHHEFNTAVILINAESWQQAGGGAQFSFTPFMNYQGYSNRVLDEGFHIDPLQRHVYLSFGAGWYVLPYLLFKMLHVPFTPAWLQILNIFINIISVVLLFRLLLSATNSSRISLVGTALFALLPAPLWYCGNGYVTVGIMMPLVILILQIWHRFEQDAHSIKPSSLAMLFLLSIALSYFDWFSVFLLGAMALWAFLSVKDSKRYLWVSLVAGASIVAGVWLVLAQFAHYLGWQQVLHYWQSRFSDRSTDTSNYSFTQMLVMIAKNLVTGYLPLLVLMSAFFAVRKANRLFQTVKWPLWALAASIPYNGLFFNWSAEHEFAWMAFSIAGSVAVSIYVLPMLGGKRLLQVASVFVIISLSIYFVVNRPGKTSWKGEKYAAQKNLGEWIKNNVDSTLPIFTNSENDRIVQYYSKRTFNSKPTPAEIAPIAKSFHVKKAIWLAIQNNQVIKDSVMYFP